MEERLYRNRDYLPHVADLPWQEDYVKQTSENLPDRQPGRPSVGGGLTLGDTAGSAPVRRRPY